MVAGLGILQGVTGWKIPDICYLTIGMIVTAYEAANTVQKFNPNNLKQIQGSVPGEGE
jgi:hypothetical protein